MLFPPARLCLQLTLSPDEISTVCLSVQWYGQDGGHERPGTVLYTTLYTLTTIRRQHYDNARDLQWTILFIHLMFKYKERNLNIEQIEHEHAGSKLLI